MKRNEVLASLVIIGITIVIVSVITIHEATKSGCGCVSKKYDVSATADRTGKDSIAITYRGGHDADQVMTNGSFVIQVNGKNATNADAVMQSGLAATLDPAIGLENKTGSMVNITGRDVSDKAHVTVITAYRDGSMAVILDTSV